MENNLHFLSYRTSFKVTDVTIDVKYEKFDHSLCVKKKNYNTM